MIEECRRRRKIKYLPFDFIGVGSELQNAI
jgi:hypothetical protein